jgi:hypothetical protein
MEFADDPVVSIYKGKKGVPSMKYRMALQFDPPSLSLVRIQNLCGSTVGHRSFLRNGCKACQATATAPRASNHPQQAEVFAASPFATWRQSECCWHCLHDAAQTHRHDRIVDEGGLGFQTFKDGMRQAETADALRRDLRVV